MAVARARGVSLNEARAAEIATAARSVLVEFRAIAADLTADDDAYEFRRLLLALHPDE